ncbi:hypothetical protein DEM27_03025 [Metarhizobium album]|uniref:Uncharacterized protein n=2 Tax=Metarhizobium album TaxID=2182425 RepID=A0A2U2DXV9_9HYPH|nr:hypothetical protein DEM27_03025 [Rhizobium album]
MISALTEQKRMVEAKITGQTFAPTHIIRRKNDEGKLVKVEVPKRLRQGWFNDASGKLFFSVRYAGKIIEFAKDKNAIEVGEFSNLPGVLDTLMEAVRAGELDTHLTTATAERRKLLRKAG